MYRLLALAIAASTALSVLLILPATAGAQQRPPIVGFAKCTTSESSAGTVENQRPFPGLSAAARAQPADRGPRPQNSASDAAVVERGDERSCRSSEAPDPVSGH
jgi:hypothetical protein